MDLKPFLLTGAGLVGLATAATSSVSLYKLAVRCGIPDVWLLPASLPIALDAGAAVAALVWITQKDDARKWGMGIALAALVATVAGNGIEHAIATNFLELTLGLVIAVGACIPAMLFSTIHLVALLLVEAEELEETEVLATIDGGKSYQPVHSGELTNKNAITFHAPEVTNFSVDLEPLKPVTTVGEHQVRVQWAVDNWQVTAKEISEKFTVSMATAYRVRKEAEKRVDH